MYCVIVQPAGRELALAQNEFYHIGVFGLQRRRTVCLLAQFSHL